ncbi:DEAD/DEAH box helicase [Candidatus Kaiserbacteria bacterium CG10_big_fil_rev_8_21_14_0_10_56_12]|uniref:DEAD/DEAH box helicase n=1 Tax=Candidatus Kaiserbacteria bacterium CG10_big_fil_rev_8_21_14_0_10_56_12 TaxID=1974611 RepID=A0A2H0U9X5_9BACT|nr:MAG: DEAD/DEAH box helicase [Candidatus Kaiserbacteria bacterium CG10_big_fil_rev_8_21_14_0_10_56_12]
MRAITFDIESISDSAVRGRVDVSEQELTVVGVHDSLTGTYSSYLQEDLPQLWPVLEAADMLIGYNSNTFDIPLLNRYYPGDLTRLHSLDLLVEVHRALGRRIRLQSLAEATLGRGKSGDGLKAADWWREGKYDKVREYCIEDVRITRELYEYAIKNGLLKYKDLRTVRDIKLDTAHWTNARENGPTLTHALPL